MKGQVFISYRRAANAWAVERLRQELVNAFGERNIFFDNRTIATGEQWSRVIDEAIHTASAVVVVFCEEWYGAEPPRGAPASTVADTAARAVRRRIDDPTDKLRIEVELALQHGRPIIPVIIDGSAEPQPQDLPESIRGICELQFLRIDIGGNTERQLDRLVADIRRKTSGSEWAWRLAGQAAWLGLLMFSVGMTLYKTENDELFRQAFARTALALRDQLPTEPPRIAVAQMTETEMRELFGGRTPLNPELVALMLGRWHAASKANCTTSLPIVIDLDLAPNAESDAEGHQAAMNRALLELAACRPVVLACPGAVRRGADAWHERRWMNAIVKVAHASANPPGVPRVVFATRQADPEGLRRAEGRSELGVVAADLAAGRRILAGHPRPQCVCPASPQIAARCADQPVEADWDNRGFAVPLPMSQPAAEPIDREVQVAAIAPMGLLAQASDDAAGNGVPASSSRTDFSLSEAIRDAERFVGDNAVLVGSNRSQARYAVPGRSKRAFDGVSGIVVQAHLFNSALSHEPQHGSWFKGLLALVSAIGVAALVLLGGRELERNNDRFANRWLAYALFAAALIGLPLLAVLVAATWPSTIWWLAVVTMIAAMAAARALISCFEIVLSRGIAWRWPTALLRELQAPGPKASPRLRLAIFVAELGVIVACASVALAAQG